MGYRRYRHSDGYTSSYSSPAVIYDDPYVPAPTVVRTITTRPPSIYRDPVVPVFKTKTYVRHPNPNKIVVNTGPRKRTNVHLHKGKRPKTRVTLPKTRVKKIVRRPKKPTKRSKA